MDLGELLDRGAISARVNAATKRQALSIVSEIAGRALDMKAAEILTKLMQRERLGSTGVGSGVAVPHATLEGLDRMHGVFVRLESPIDFGAMDEQPVDLIFALLAPADHPAEHLRALAKVSRALRQADLRQQLRQAHGIDAIRALMVRDPRSTAA
ncbi:MAG: ptsN [Caulobacteraceae bacterium]|nr:ptsN [Caulobacteraceae bacterium]